MVTKETCGTITWVDVESPTKEEIRRIMDEYSIHPLIGEELLSPTLRPKVDVYGNLIYLILHFPTIAQPPSNKMEQEIDFVIGKNLFITVHYGIIDALTKANRLFNVSAILKKCDAIGGHAGFIFFHLIKELYHNLILELEFVQKELDDIEENIFKGQEHFMVSRISKTTRKLLHFKKSVAQHQHVLESLEHVGESFFGKEFNYYLHAIIGEYYKVSAHLESSVDTLRELKTTNDSLLTTKTNDIMKTLTIMAFITLPLTFFSQLFGMNTAYLPIVGGKNDFWIIIGIMIFSTAVFVLFFKRKNWL